MTNDDSPNKNSDGAVLETQATPEHRNGFWSELESAMTSDGNESSSAPPTEELQVAPVTSAPHSVADELTARRNRRRIWPMAAAAAALALVGIGFLATRSGTDPGLSTDLVAGTPGAADIVPLDGPQDESADSNADASDGSGAEGAEADDSGSAAASGGATADTDGDPEPDSGAAVDPLILSTPRPEFEPWLDFVPAVGATGEPEFFPSGGAPRRSTFLANSEQDSVTWWAVTKGYCIDPQYSTIRSVNGSSLQELFDRRDELITHRNQARSELDAFIGQLPVLRDAEELPAADVRELERLNGEWSSALEALGLLDRAQRLRQGVTQDAFEPNLSFSGDISHFTTSAGGKAAWLVSCGPQIEFWVGSIVPGGRLADAHMVWFGPGQSQNGLMLWVENEVSVSLLGTDGTPFSIEYETVEQTVTRNGRPTRFQLESGVIEHRSTPAAASADGDLSYWPGISDQGEGACAGSFGRANTLWLRRLTTEAIPVWEPALAEDTRIGQVTAMAIEDEFSQVAFADVCPDEVGRVFIATQRADGRLSNLREIDLSPFVPGFADALYWVDSETLRIETDNSQYSVDAVRFDFRLDDGRENGVMVQLD